MLLEGVICNLCACVCSAHMREREGEGERALFDVLSIITG